MTFLEGVYGIIQGNIDRGVDVRRDSGLIIRIRTGYFENNRKQVLQGAGKIKAIIQDDSLEDKECVNKIEKIVCTLEEIGSSGGNRHDFG